jgi:enediyne biosynthesis protein E4
MPARHNPEGAAPRFRWTLAFVAICACLPAAVKAPQFHNVAIKSKFTYVTHNGYTARKYFIQPMCGGIAILDYDNDGKPDIFFTNGAELPSLQKTSPLYNNCLLHNRGDGTFEDRTEAAGLLGRDLGYSFGVAAGDYDNDGHGDLFVCNAGRNALYHNNGNGTFTDVTAQSGLAIKPPNTLSVDAAWFDYDNDGLLDLVVSNYTTWTPETDIRCQDQGVEKYCSPTQYSSVANRLYHNLGKGRFEDVTEQSGFASARGKGMGISIADFNGDGFQDVFIANDTERNFLFINQGDGTFKEVGLLYGVAYNDDGVAVSGMGSDAKDFNNDGTVDVFYNDLTEQIFGLFANEGGKSFRYNSVTAGLSKISRRFSGWSAGFVDYDNDGWKDLYSANGDVDSIGDNAAQHDTMFKNEGGIAFRDISADMGADFLPLGFHRGSAFADLNNDGSMDIVVTALNERPRILMNAGTPGNHWLMLDLVGSRSNRDAIGARVKVTTPSGRTLYNHVSVSTGFMSSSDKRVHFGLGREKSAQSIEIRWPSGLVQRLADVVADRTLRIDEPI